MGARASNDLLLNNEGGTGMLWDGDLLDMGEVALYVLMRAILCENEF